VVHILTAVLKGFKEEIDAKRKCLGYRPLTYRYFLIMSCWPSGTYLEQRKPYFRVTSKNFQVRALQAQPGLLYELSSYLDFTESDFKMTAEQLQRIWMVAVLKGGLKEITKNIREYNRRHGLDSNRGSAQNIATPTCGDDTLRIWCAGVPFKMSRPALGPTRGGGVKRSMREAKPQSPHTSPWRGA
jgi:hypothetical protein